MAVMRLLLELGADVDIEGDDNMTPLHYAARFDHSLNVTIRLFRPVLRESRYV